MTQKQREKQIERLLKQSRVALFFIVPAVVFPFVASCVYAVCLDRHASGLFAPSLTLGLVLGMLCALQCAYKRKLARELFREYEYFRITGF